MGKHLDSVLPCTMVAPGHPWPPRHRCFPAQWSLSAFHGLRDTGASLHNGRSRPSMASATPVLPCTMESNHRHADFQDE